MAGNKGDRLGVVTVSQRDAAVGGTARSGGDPGNDLETDIFLHQLLQLFAASAEDKRIAAFEAHHPFVVTCQFDQ